MGTEPPGVTLDYLLQTAPSASSALWLLLISLINGPTVLPEEELSVSFRAPSGGLGTALLVKTWALASLSMVARERSQATVPSPARWVGGSSPREVAVSLPATFWGDSGLEA